MRLRNEFYADRDPAGQSFAKAKAQLVRTAENRVGRTSLGTVDPAGAKAVYEFQKRLDATVDEYRAGNKDPWELLDPKSPKFALNWVQQRSPIDVIREQAESFRNAAEGKITTIKDDADYAKLPPGAKFVDPQGKIRQKPGAAPKQKAPDYIGGVDG